MVTFQTYFSGDTEYCRIFVDNVYRFQARKIVCFNPYWVLYNVQGVQIARHDTLVEMKREIENN